MTVGESLPSINVSIRSSSEPSSKAFDDDGDADMDDRQRKLQADQPPFTSELQAAAKAAASSSAATPKPMPTSKPKPPKHLKRNSADRASMRGEDGSQAATSPGEQPMRVTQSRGPAVWSKAGSAHVRAILSGSQQSPATPTVRRPAQPTDPTLLDDLECARKDANLRRDGDQRLMTKHESSVLFKVLSQQLELEQLPSFLLETHTSAERDVLADFHRDHLGWRLYMVMPPGITFRTSAPCTISSIRSCSPVTMRKQKTLLPSSLQRLTPSRATPNPTLRYFGLCIGRLRTSGWAESSASERNK